MTVATAAQSRVYIGTTANAQTLANFQADTYTEVGEVEDLGEFGDEAEEITFTALADRRVRKFKGSFNAGTVSVQCGSDPRDLGQAAMITALSSDLDYNFKIELNDAITLSGTPTTLFFRGKVMSKRRNVGNVSNIVRQTYNVGVNSAILEQAST